MDKISEETWKSNINKILTKYESIIKHIDNYNLDNFLNVKHCSFSNFYLSSLRNTI